MVAEKPATSRTRSGSRRSRSRTVTGPPAGSRRRAAW
jgi:hypothetical protein